MPEHLYICDHLSSLRPGEDTTLALARASRGRGRISNWCLMRDLRWVDGTLWGQLRPFDDRMEVVEGSWRQLGSQELVFVRTDPPVDASYFAVLWLLDAMRVQGLRVINDPRALCYANEKTMILNFPELIPATIVSADANSIREFVAAQGKAVVKPLDGNGGRGVLLLATGDTNLNSLIDVSLARVKMNHTIGQDGSLIENSTVFQTASTASKPPRWQFWRK